jgi:hypothetical protein
MDTDDTIDIGRILQEELDALSVNDPTDEIYASDDDNDDDHYDRSTDDQEEMIKQIMDETRDNLERAMRERLLAFEHEINTNFQRYEIDYDEIDQLLQRPMTNNDNEIQINVARNCGIERDVLTRVSQSMEYARCSCLLLYNAVVFDLVQII